MIPQWVRTSPTMRVAMQACRRHLRFAALFSALLNLLIVAPMLYMLQVYDRVLPTQGVATLLLLTLALVIALGTMAVLEAIRSRLLVRAGLQLDRELSGLVMRASLRQTDGSRLSRQYLREFDTLRQAMTGPAMHGLFDAPWVPIYTIVAFLIHPWIGVLSIAGTLLILALAWRSENSTRAPLQQANAAAGRSYAIYDGSLQSADVARSLGMSEALVRGHLADRNEMVGLQYGAGMISARLTAESKFVRMLLQSLALGLGALLAVNGEVGAAAIFAASFIVGRALAPIDQLIGGWRTIVHARASIDTLDELLVQAPGPHATTRMPKPEGRLDVEQLGVAGETEKPILAAVSFRVAPGEVVAIVGPSGAGKSTLVRCLAGAQVADVGFIRFDAAEQRDWDPAQLSSEVGFMPQETSLFAGSIKDNISRFEARLGTNASDVDEAVIAAAMLAGAHEMILLLPGGYDHRLPVGGRGLSAGQAQRVALARALYRSPRYVLLDEPNASLDAEGDAQLTTTLEALKAAGTTVLVVAHRLSLLPVVDKILVLRDGRVALFGGRDEVIQTLRRGPAQLAANA
ncbi:type I secretion system permease/ATPase [Sphingomonas sp. LHG3406-1]|uniref:type I secretion system permease/ATPase n=1 Tax=Sphingomonas sp. LHG3406-1 TaxID=2804617 RepID=UPI00262541AB|nr:type I secretion system permease/ATPase [Sphingomonas sp. LHG3406-1]